MAGRLSDVGFALNLAKEWASFPVLAPVQGQRRKLKRGQSYYSGDGLNKALVKPEVIEALLVAARAAGDVPKPVTPPAPPETPASEPPKPGNWVSALVAFIAAIIAAFRRKR
jgi:hypothetical protein